MYRFRSPEGAIVEAGLSELARGHGLSYESVKALAYGRQRQHRGWRCLEPRHPRLRQRRNGSRHVLHRWRHDDGREVVMTAAELARHDRDTSSKVLYVMASQGVRSHRGWRWQQEVASWPRRLIAFRDPTGARVERMPLELLRREGLSLEEVEALLGGKDAAGWAPTLRPAAAA